MEPAGVGSKFASGFKSWQKEQPRQHKHEDWRRFWLQVNTLLDYDYGFLGDPPEGWQKRKNCKQSYAPTFCDASIVAFTSACTRAWSHPRFAPSACAKGSNDSGAQCRS